MAVPPTQAEAVVSMMDQAMDEEHDLPPIVRLPQHVQLGLQRGQRGASRIWLRRTCLLVLAVQELRRPDDAGAPPTNQRHVARHQDHQE